MVMNRQTCNNGWTLFIDPIEQKYHWAGLPFRSLHDLHRD